MKSPENMSSPPAQASSGFFPFLSRSFPASSCTVSFCLLSPPDDELLEGRGPMYPPSTLPGHVYRKKEGRGPAPCHNPSLTHGTVTGEHWALESHTPKFKSWLHSLQTG